MGALQVDDDRLIFAALGLVDGGGVGQIQHFKVAAVILGNSAIAEINGQHAVGVIAGDGSDITDIAIADAAFSSGRDLISRAGWMDISPAIMGVSRRPVAVES